VVGIQWLNFHRRPTITFGLRSIDHGKMSSLHIQHSPAIRATAFCNGT